jgi:hypothetical protein
MVRSMLGSERVLDITIHDDCCGNGKVDTRSRMGDSYYHLICWNSFLHDRISLLSFFMFGHALSFLSPFFHHSLSMSLFFSFSHSPCLFFKETFRERERGHTTYGALFLWNEWMI